VLKDEPDDLTHLAPIAGDACIPLDESAPFFSDMFDDFIMPDNYNLLTDDLNSLDSQCSSKSASASNSSSNDPFINYRDDSNDTNNSPHLLSPGLSKVIYSPCIHNNISHWSLTRFFLSLMSILLHFGLKCLVKSHQLSTFVFASHALSRGERYF
jgi:hypothetical protein